MLPDFIIVGAPKAGTTSLYHYLMSHPQVFMSEPKEVNFFSSGEISNQGLYYNDYLVKNLADYENLFASATSEQAIGEGSVSYLFYPQTPAKIKSVIPNVKIIILLRNPVERGFSHYLMDYRLGFVGSPYDEIVYQTGSHENIHLYYQQYVELGLYYEQVKRYLELFGKAQVRIYLQEDLRTSTDKVIQDLYEFLGVDVSFSPHTEREHNVFSMPKNRAIQKLYSNQVVRSIVSMLFSDTLKEQIINLLFETKNKPVLNKKVSDYLHQIYSSDIEKLENLICKDLSNWYGKDLK